MRRVVTLTFIFVFLWTTAESEIDPKLQALCEGDSALAKLNDMLLRTRIEVQKGAPVLAAMHRHVSRSIRENTLQCIIGVTEITDDFLKACAAANLMIVGAYEKHGMSAVTVRVKDPRQFDELVRRSDVRLIFPEPPAITLAGSVANQADVSINADDARATYSVDGAGVRVGVLSDTVNRVIGGTAFPVSAKGFLIGSGPQLIGDLPGSIRVVDAGPAAGSDEGAGMMELIYDLAPNCDLSFASAFSGYFAFASNITALRTDPGFRCDVIVDDVIYFAEPMYQDGPIAIAARNAVQAGVPYFSSAGNYADDAHEAVYRDTNLSLEETALQPTGVDFHNFGVAYGAISDTHLKVTLGTGTQITVVLHWDEPYGGGAAAGPGSEADLDLYLTSSTSLPLTDPNQAPGAIGPGDNVIAKSLALQGNLGVPFGDAYEIIQYTHTGSTQPAYLVIDHYRGREIGLTLHLMITLSGSGTINDSNLLRDRTIFGHAAAEGVNAVAAMFYGEIDTEGSFSGGSGLDVELFSSLGGNLPFWFSDDGTRFSSPVQRFKPEITAPDGTNTSFFGFDTTFDSDLDPNFFGTSAAAPHAAAVAALMLDADSTLPPSDITDVLRSTAIDAEQTGRDSLSGDGLIDAFEAVKAVAPTGVEDWMLF